MYHKHSKKGIVHNYRMVISDDSQEELSENTCASICKLNDNCASFDYCVANKEQQNKERDGKTAKKYACYLHDQNPLQDKKKNKEREEIGYQTHCDHYNCKYFKKKQLIVFDNHLIIFI